MQKKKFWDDFKKFVSRGNVVDLAVALVVGAAFNKIVSQLVDSFINPLISILIGGLSLEDWKYVIKEAVIEDGVVLEAEVAFTFGIFLQTVIDFLIIALTVFIIVRLYNRLKGHLEEEGKRIYEELNPELVEQKRKEEEEKKKKEEEAQKKLEAEKKAEEERKKELERLQKEKEEAQLAFFKEQSALLHEIRDSLNKK
ncbi:MAG: large conductance mechanosensitive channel protein MscL [Clostridia bacterium]|nr:large conductance mechanosensitive channel protein MscL [Clostridia bacterium]